ncbi:hypothetical protein F5Y05DRAFT_373111 [Hypoxylon sp. FL0543]|nr:hypothetical protein F5Y05DRAFT_373111 [Hypoxylon sp. FL0543]
MFVFVRVSVRVSVLVLHSACVGGCCVHVAFHSYLSLFKDWAWWASDLEVGPLKLRRGVSLHLLGSSQREEISTMVLLSTALQYCILLHNPNAR